MHMSALLTDDPIGDDFAFGYGDYVTLGSVPGQ